MTDKLEHAVLAGGCFEWDLIAACTDVVIACPSGTISVWARCLIS